MMRNGQSATFQLLFQQFLLGTSVPRIIQSSFILIRISIEVSMYLKIISISGLNKIGKRICLTQLPQLCIQSIPFQTFRLQLPQPASAAAVSTNSCPSLLIPVIVSIECLIQNLDKLQYCITTIMQYHPSENTD